MVTDTIVCLALGPASRHRLLAMKQASLRRLVILLLGVFVALGVSLSAVQSGDMTVKMAVSVDMDGGGHGGCESCPGGDDDGAAGCVAGCTVAAFAVLPASSGDKALQAPDLTLPVLRNERGTVFSPDPYPPRLSDFS